MENSDKIVPQLPNLHCFSKLGGRQRVEAVLSPAPLDLTAVSTPSGSDTHSSFVHWSPLKTSVPLGCDLRYIDVIFPPVTAAHGCEQSQGMLWALEFDFLLTGTDCCGGKLHCHPEGLLGNKRAQCEAGVGRGEGNGGGREFEAVQMLQLMIFQAIQLQVNLQATPRLITKAIPAGWGPP